MADANIVELRRIVKTFHVPELKVLLSFAGRNRLGLKKELIERALPLITSKNAAAIAVQIHEINKKRQPVATSTSSESSSSSGQSGSSTNNASTSNVTLDKPTTSQNTEPPGRAAQPALLTTVNRPVPSTSNNVANANSSGPSGLKQALEMIPGSLNLGALGHSQTIVHPDVRFKSLPFYEYLYDLVKPSCLSVSRGGSFFQENYYSFHFTPQQAKDINRSRFMANEFIEEFGLQVLLRFCLSETTCEQEDNFPSISSVRVNGTIAQLPNTIPSNKQGVEPKRPGRPVDITHYCKLVPTEPNRIEVLWNTDHIRNYCVMVSLERHLDANTLMSRLKQRGLKHPDHTRALIKEKLAANSDTEIATTSLRISLICPLGKMRMVVPTRSLGCNHLQCFDAPTYIHMNEKKSSWLCPICDRPAEFKNLFIDGLFTEILSKTSDTNDIEFTANGTWSPFLPKAEQCNVDDSVLVQTIDDDSSPEDSNCIDLTETDDEDCAHIPSRPTSCKSAYSLSSDSTVTSKYTSLASFNLVEPSATTTIDDAAASYMPQIYPTLNANPLYDSIYGELGTVYTDPLHLQESTLSTVLEHHRPASTISHVPAGPPSLSPYWQCDPWLNTNNDAPSTSCPSVIETISNAERTTFDMPQTDTGHSPRERLATTVSRPTSAASSVSQSEVPASRPTSPASSISQSEVPASKRLALSCAAVANKRSSSGSSSSSSHSSKRSNSSRGSKKSTKSGTESLRSNSGSNRPMSAASSSSGQSDSNHSAAGSNRTSVSHHSVASPAVFSPASNHASDSSSSSDTPGSLQEVPEMPSDSSLSTSDISSPESPPRVDNHKKLSSTDVISIDSE